MKLLITKIDNANNVIALAERFFCKTEVREGEIIITINTNLTSEEFSLLAGKLVIAGFNVELLENGYN